MQLEWLTLIHLPKKDYQQDSPAFNIPHSVFINTCQRQIWVTHKALNAEKFPEVYYGKGAYEFLLRVCTGLESAVVGETDVFGQVKEAWQFYQDNQTPFVPELFNWKRKIFHKLFEDTKEIRSRFLQGIGGSSYGSLVRLLFRKTKTDGPIFVLGAGQLTQSILPYLGDQKLFLWNRTQEKLTSLTASGNLTSFEILSDEFEGWYQAKHVLICIPVDIEQDAKRIAAWNLKKEKEGSLIHLGCRKGSPGHSLWNSAQADSFFTLDDLFELEKSQNAMRTLQIDRARRACTERAQLRELGSSITIPHGWEDLVAFS